MITLHKLNGSDLVINADLIESLEGGHETVVALTTGNRYVVRESAKEIIEKVVSYHRQTHEQSFAARAGEAG